MKTYLRVLEHIQINRLKGKAFIKKEEILTKRIVDSIEICRLKMLAELKENSPKKGKF